MNGQRTSCCDTPTEMTRESAARPETPKIAHDDSTDGQLAAVPGDRGRSGLTRVVRRLFGIGEPTEKA
jgi:hypothetical protein